MPTVYGTPLSPYVSKVLVMLEFKGIMYELLPIETHYSLTEPEHHDHHLNDLLRQEYLKISPQGTVPAYQDEQVTLADSSLICHYLERRYPTPAMTPTNSTDQAKLKWLEAFSDHFISPMFEELFYQQMIKPKWLAQSPDQARIEELTDDEIPMVLNYLESFVPKQQYIFGRQLSFADLVLAMPFLTALCSHFFIDPTRWPTLYRYIERLLNHDLMIERTRQNLAWLGR